ncbi:MAG: hypothetical protein KKE05_01805, partial [Nanoarchaeota archaeon]|nr:hypothetical protein [Nanoarchaeota archaeon]
MSKGAYAVLVVGVLILMSSYLVSAGIGDWFRGITGRASTTGEANATVTLSGSNAVVVLILNETLIGTVVDPSEAGARRIEVNV